MARPFDKLTPRLYRQGPRASQAWWDLLLLHGAWHGAWCWSGLAEGLAAAGYGVNLLELPGHGNDQWRLPAQTSLKDYADLARRAAGQLDRPVLIGHCMGGWLVQKVLEAADLPAVLLAPLPGSGLPMGNLLSLLARHPLASLAPVVGQPLVVSTPAMCQRLMSQWLPLCEVEGHWRRLVPEPPLVALEMALGLVRARPPQGRQPRLVLLAERDRLISLRAGSRLARRLGAQLKIIPAAPHNLWQEDPQNQVLEAILHFLNQID